MNHCYSNNYMQGSIGGMGTMGYNNAFNGFNNDKKQMNYKSDSLFSMAMYDVSHQNQAAAAPRHPSQFYPVDEYKDLSLREILDLSEDCLFTEEDDTEPMNPLPLDALSAPIAHPITSLHEDSNGNMCNDDLEWSQLEDPPMIASGLEEIPVAAALISSIDTSAKKRSRELILDQEFDGEEVEFDEAGNERRFRPYQTGQWSEKFEELCVYRKKNGHCLVPHTYKENLPLARWVKRQRYQYKLMKEGKSSTMTEDRVQALEDIDFVWDSQGAAWGERLSELRDYRNTFYHCNVPSNYSENPQLATWVKCQRRQYKLHMEGKPSNMTTQRIQELDTLGFEWELRSYKKQRTL